MHQSSVHSAEYNMIVLPKKVFRASVYLAPQCQFCPSVEPTIKCVFISARFEITKV